jgi:isopentenyldiphosphate isomerase
MIFTKGLSLIFNVEKQLITMYTNVMKLPIVDENDHIIGYKERGALDSKDIFRTASLWITNSNDDVLLAQRKYDKKVDPGKWAEAVGGTVEGGDSYSDTIIREAEEELGLTGLKIEQGPKQFITTPCEYFVQWYTTTVDAPIESFIIQPEGRAGCLDLPRAAK